MARTARRAIGTVGAVTLRLTVDTAAWEQHIASVVAAVPGLVPVVKGNGYGFGRGLLVERAAAFADTVAVGTIHELDVAPRRDAASGDCCDIVVLTPTLRPPTPAHTDIDIDIDPILTVSSPAHVDALTGDGRRRRVLVKLATSMRRYGIDPERLTDLVERARSAGLDMIGVALHLPLAGSDEQRVDEILGLLPRIDPVHEVWLSHLGPDAYAALPATHRYRLRLGTLLWHGDKSMLHLTAEVLDTRPVTAGGTAGYHRTPLPTEGTLIMIGAGTAHGVHPLPDGRSPFHHARTRLALLEPPHMHTSMAFVPAGSPVPDIGQRVDVQRPLTTTNVDEIDWT